MFFVCNYSSAKDVENKNELKALTGEQKQQEVKKTNSKSIT